MALSPLCSHLLDSLVSPLGQPVTSGSRFLPASALKPSGCMDAHPSCGWPHSHAVLLLPGYQPLFFRSCSYRSLDTKTQPFSPFPHAKPAGALGQCASPLWVHRPHRVTRGTSNLPGCIVNFWCSQGLAGSVCLSPRGATALHQGASPQPGVGTNQHQPAPHNFPSSSFWRVQESPGAAQALPRVCSLPPPGTASRPAGGTYLHALCVFLSERRGGR